MKNCFAVGAVILAVVIASAQAQQPPATRAAAGAVSKSSYVPAKTPWGDPDIQGGTPCFAGTRVPVKSLFDAIARGRSVDYFLEQFPSVKREQIQAVLQEAEQLLRTHGSGSHAA